MYILQRLYFWRICEGILKSDKTRKTFYEQYCDYTEPTQMYLGADAAVKELMSVHFHQTDTDIPP